MKRFLCLAAATIAICLIATATIAQSSLRLRFQVPFPFTIENASFSAGEYEVTMPANKILELRNLKDQTSRFEPALRAHAEEDADGRVRLIFHRYGSEYFLSVVSDGSRQSTYRFHMSKEERLIADASPRPQPKVVSVLVNGTVQTANAGQK
jgi:hypothetical protein